jgi:hypothetical protein
MVLYSVLALVAVYSVVALQVALYSAVKLQWALPNPGPLA